MSYVKADLSYRGRVTIMEPKTSLLVTPLPACRHCGHVHPEAMKPRPSDIHHCPGCGETVVEGRSQYVDSELNWDTPWGWVAKLCYAVAKGLRRLAERI